MSKYINSVITYWKTNPRTKRFEKLKKEEKIKYEKII